MVAALKRSKMLIFILLVGLFLRVYDYQNIPKAIYGDGLTLVYDSYSILKTGHDQRGDFMPLVFPLGGSRPPLYVYATVPFVALLGPTDLAARSVAILSGLGIILLMYFLGKRIQSRKLGLIAAAFTAISSWDISLSRGSFETHFALFLALFGVLAFYKGQEKFRWYIWSALGFALSMQTYPTYRLTVPLFIIAMVLIYKEQFLTFVKTKSKLAVTSVVLVLLSFLLSVYVTFSGGQDDRFTTVNLFNDSGVQAQIASKVGIGKQYDPLPLSIKNLLHNKDLEYVSLISTYYVRNFFPNFLFIIGDGNPRHNPGEMGEFYWIDALLIGIGIYFMYKKHTRTANFLVIWILIAPIATSLVGPAHALRDTFMLPPLLLFSAFGLLQLLDNHKLKYRQLISLGLLGLFVFQFALFVDKFYFIAPSKNETFWSYPAKQAAQLALTYKNNYQYIILSANIDNMEFAYPVYAKLDPKLVIYQNEHLDQKTWLGGYQFFQYGNVYIGSIPSGALKTFFNNMTEPYLYVGPSNDQNYLAGSSTDLNADALPDLFIKTNKDSVDVSI